MAGAGQGQWCEKHWAVVRDDRSINGLLAAVLLMEYLLEDDAFMRRCGYDPQTGAKAQPERINAEMAKIGPICCYLGEERMQQLYRQARAEGGMN